MAALFKAAQAGVADAKAALEANRASGNEAAIEAAMAKLVAAKKVLTATMGHGGNASDTLSHRVGYGSSGAGGDLASVGVRHFGVLPEPPQPPQPPRGGALGGQGERRGRAGRGGRKGGEDQMMNELKADGWAVTMTQYTAGKKFKCISPDGTEEYSSVRKAHALHCKRKDKQKAEQEAAANAAPSPTGALEREGTMFQRVFNDPGVRDRSWASTYRPKLPPTPVPLVPPSPYASPVPQTPSPSTLGGVSGGVSGAGEMAADEWKGNLHEHASLLMAVSPSKLGNEGLDFGQAGGSSGGAATSSFRGVKASNRLSNPMTWRTTIKHDKHTHYLGTFNDEEQAARAYDLKALELKGPEDAVTNFPAYEYVYEVME